MTRRALFGARGIVALLCSLGSAPIASAQERAADAANDAAGDVVVVGADMKERRARANAYVRATGIARSQPAARWSVPICPKVSGVGPETAVVVLSRFRALAGQVGAPLATGTCTPNAIVTFTDDGPAVASRVAARAPHQFKDVPMVWRRALLQGNAPIRWWHIVKTGDADGVPPVGMQPSFVQIGGGAAGDGLPMGSGGVQMRYKEGMISSQSSRTIIGASVVIDVKRAGTRRDLDALGDYAALVALAEFRPAAPPPPDSILSLFDEDQPADSATPSDVALLKQIYAIPLDREAKAHRRMLANALLTAQSHPGR